MTDTNKIAFVESNIKFLHNLKDYLMTCLSEVKDVNKWHEVYVDVHPDTIKCLADIEKYIVEV